jgi:hypothetical protein
MKEPRNDAGLYTLTRTNTLDTNQGGTSAGVSRALQLGDGEPGNEVCADRSLASVQNCSQRPIFCKTDRAGASHGPDPSPDRPLAVLPCRLKSGVPS